VPVDVVPKCGRIFGEERGVDNVNAGGREWGKFTCGIARTSWRVQKQSLFVALMPKKK